MCPDLAKPCFDTYCSKARSVNTYLPHEYEFLENIFMDTSECIIKIMEINVHKIKQAIYRIARNFRGLKSSQIGLLENFRDFIFADGCNDLMTY